MKRATHTENLYNELNEKISVGGKIADKIAEFGGSWTFILCFVATMITWIVINVILASKAFDPYPFILLNLALSCLAALQAPVIMMSQNRQEAKDRLRAELDYKINIKAEQEICALREMLDEQRKLLTQLINESSKK